MLVLLGARKGASLEEEDEVGVEAVKPEMEKARMADDDARRAAEGERDGRKEGRTRGRPLLTFPANVSRHENDLAVSAPRSRLSPLRRSPKGQEANRKWCAALTFFCRSERRARERHRRY